MINVTMIWGTVANGKPVTGAGYNVVNVEPGVWDVKFLAPFAVAPAVVATQLYPNLPNNTGGNTLDNAVVAYIDRGIARIITGDNTGKHVNRDFSFTAVAG